MGRLVRWLTGPSETEIRAGLPRTMPEPRLGVSGQSTLSSFTFPAVGVSKASVLAIPTLQRAHDLIVSLVSGLPLVPYAVTWSSDSGQVEALLPPKPWHLRPDPAKTRNFLLGALASDLWAYRRAYLRVTSRYAEGGFPASFTWMPVEYVDAHFPPWAVPECGLVPGCTVTFGGAEVEFRDVIEFVSPVTGVCEVAWRAIQTATSLEEAALRFAGTEVPAGWLKQTGGEPLSADELAEFAANFHEARKANTTAALNEFMDYVESKADPSKMQLVEGRQYQALELSRVGNVPPYLVGAPAGTGMTYLNGQQARTDLVDFGAAPIIATIDQTLSGPAITPAGNFVRLDKNAWLTNPFLDNQPTETDVEQAVTQEAPS